MVIINFYNYYMIIITDFIICTITGQSFNSQIDSFVSNYLINNCTVVG